jgi:hypothetical protein
LAAPRALRSASRSAKTRRDGELVDGVAVAVLGEGGGAGAVLAPVQHAPVDQGVEQARQLQTGRVGATGVGRGKVGEGGRHLGRVQDDLVAGAGGVEGAQDPEVGDVILGGDVAEQAHPVVEPEVVEPERRLSRLPHRALLVLGGSHRTEGVRQVRQPGDQHAPGEVQAGR